MINLKNQTELFTSITFPKVTKNNVIKFDVKDTERLKQEKRLNSISKVYALQSVAKNVLNKIVTEKYKTVNKKTGDIYHRSMICQSIPNYYAQRHGSGQGVTISKDGKASFYGVGSCGMGWTCPVCARKICHQRKLEIDQGMKAIREKGWTALMVTLTHSHHINEPLGDKIKRKSAALSFLKGHRDFEELKKTIGYEGQIRALEVTHGENGWHPHTHEMWILNRRITKDQVAGIKKAIFRLWKNACIAKGLGEPSEAHGVDVSFKEGDDSDCGMIGSYLAKFGFELTNSQGKKASNAGRNAWQILESLKAKFNKPDAELFREYSEAMYGKSIVFWSRGLKKLLGVNGESEEIADLKKQIKDIQNKIKLDDLSDSEIGLLVHEKSLLLIKVRDLLLQAKHADDLFVGAIEKIEFSLEDWGMIKALRLHAYVLRQAEIGVILRQRGRVEKWLWLQKKRLIKLDKHGFLISRHTRFKYSLEPDVMREKESEAMLKANLPVGSAPSQSLHRYNINSLVLGCRFDIDVVREEV